MKNTLLTSLVVSLCLQSPTTQASKLQADKALEEKSDTALGEPLHHRPAAPPCDDSSEKCFLDKRIVAVHRMLEKQGEISLLKHSNKNISEQIGYDNDLIKKELAKNDIVKKDSNEEVGEKEILGKKVAIVANEYEEEVKAWSDKNTLIHKINADTVYDYAFLSALAYSDKMFDANESNSKEVNKIAGKIKVQEDIEKILEAHISNITRLSSDLTKKGGKEFTLLQTKLAKELGIETKNKSSGDLIEAVREKLTQTQNTIIDLEKSLKTVSSDTTKKLQSFLDKHNLSHLTAKGVFYRNNGELSGFAAYDAKQAKLIIVCAGSKSGMDWLTNLKGWNGKANAKSGGALLNNINLHSGFLKHFTDMYDSMSEQAFAMINDLASDAENKGKKLTITGTGHSLGGALAEIFTAAAKNAAKLKGHDVNAEAVTFGGARIAHSGSIAALNKIFGGAGNVINIRNEYDPVPGATGLIFKNNPGVNIVIKNNLLSDRTGAFKFIGNPHGMEEYLHGLKDEINTWNGRVGGLKEAAQRRMEHQNTLARNNQKIAGLVLDIGKETQALITLDYKHREALNSVTGQKVRQEKIEEIQKEADKLEKVILDLADKGDTESLKSAEAMTKQYEVLTFDLEDLKKQTFFSKEIEEKIVDTKRKSAEFKEKFLAKKLQEIGKEPSKKEIKTEEKGFFDKILGIIGL